MKFIKNNESIRSTLPKKQDEDTKKSSLVSKALKKHILNTVTATSIAITGIGCVDRSSEEPGSKSTPTSSEQSNIQQDIDPTKVEALSRGYEYLSEYGIYVRALPYAYNENGHYKITDPTGKHLSFPKVNLDTTELYDYKIQDFVTDPDYTNNPYKKIFREFKTGKVGILSKDKKIQTPFEYDDIEITLHPNRFIATKGKKGAITTQLITEQNKVIIPASNSYLVIDKNVPSYIAQHFDDENKDPLLFDYEGKNIGKLDRKMYFNIFKKHFACSGNRYYESFDPTLSKKELHLFHDLIKHYETLEYHNQGYRPQKISKKYVLINNTIYDLHRNIVYSIPDNVTIGSVCNAENTDTNGLVSSANDQGIFLLEQYQKSPDTGADTLLYGAFDANTGLLIKPSKKNKVEIQRDIVRFDEGSFYNKLRQAKAILD